MLTPRGARDRDQQLTMGHVRSFRNFLSYAMWVLGSHEAMPGLFLEKIGGTCSGSSEHLDKVVVVHTAQLADIDSLDRPSS